METMEIRPVAIFHGEQKYRSEVPRQGIFSHTGGVIEFVPGCNYEEALRDLSGFSRIWVLFCFHLNHGWKPKVQPPVSPQGKKIGLFATRSPHRPNPIGLSCVELEKIEGRFLYISHSDILDGSPVLDVKPYIPAADSFPESRTGWLEETAVRHFEVDFSENVLERFEFVRKHTGLNLVNFAQVQLSIDPLRSERKRIFYIGNKVMIGCRTWRIEFTVKDDSVMVQNLFSGYTSSELASADDPYTDKAVHREFVERFGLL